MLHDWYDEDAYLDTLEAEARGWAERHFEDDAAQIARAARTRAVERRAGREREVDAGAAGAPRANALLPRRGGAPKRV